MNIDGALLHIFSLTSCLLFQPKADQPRAEPTASRLSSSVLGAEV
jgi:hypothetical protein